MAQINWTNAPTAAEQLALAQQAKLEELNTACQATIYAGFDCDPDGSGTTYHFPYESLDQRRYDGYMVDVLSGDAANQAWKVQDPNGNWIAVTITPENFKTNVRTKATSFELAQVNQFRALETDVGSAASVNAVTAIVWSPATTY